MKKNQRKIKEGLILVNQIQKIRSKNNKNWMDLLRLSLKLDFNSTSKILKEICKDDKRISSLAQKIFKLNKFNNAVKSTSFDALQNLEEMGKFSENVYSVNEKKKIKFFNQGPNNDWRKILNKDLIKKMNEIYKEDLIKFNYEL